MGYYDPGLVREPEKERKERGRPVYYDSVLVRENCACDIDSSYAAALLTTAKMDYYRLFTFQLRCASLHQGMIITRIDLRGNLSYICIHV